MRSTLFVLAAAALLSAPLTAANRHQSYISFDEGNTTVVQASDEREIDARVNMPLFAGDEIRSGRSGRTEVRLADDNVLAVDRGSSVRFKSFADNYDGDASESVVTMDFGEVIVHRTYSSSAALRLDTQVASYVGSKSSLFAVRSDGRGADVLSVYQGSVEVRTESGTDRVKAGDEAKLDADGVYGSTRLASDGTSDFERWYLRRANRYDRHTSRYLGDRFASYDNDFDSYGSWLYVNDYGTYVWRPRVSNGWRPYYYGRWVYSPGGALVWASDEPWGWMPYHYGRWAYSAGYGWVWLPGSVYSPAWVFWAYGPSYIGWVPSGFYDCYRPYYDWMYHSYGRASVDFGGGFYGRVRLNDIDLKGWTFSNSSTLVSNRVDRAALTVDAIRERIGREGDTVTVGSTPARFTRDQLRNPADAIRVINRGAVGGGTGKGDSGSSADLTPFFRRDPELPSAVRERIVRGVTPGTADSAVRGSRDGGSTLPTRIDRDPEVSGGSSAVRGEGTVVRRDPATGSGSTVQRPSTVDVPATPRGGRGDDWRNRGTVDRGAVDRPSAPAVTPRQGDAGQQWRSRPVVRRDSPEAPVAPATRGSDAIPAPRAGGEEWRRPVRRDTPAVDDTPRRVIDRIGGARVEPAPRGSSNAPRPVDRPAPVERPAPAERPREQSAPPPREHSSARSNDDSNEHVHRD